MRQFQVIVEYNGHRLFATEWVTGKEAATKLVMLIASKFPEPYLVMVSERDMSLQAIPWDAFITQPDAA
jgi:hypothetical protein